MTRPEPFPLVGALSQPASGLRCRLDLDLFSQRLSCLQGRPDLGAKLWPRLSRVANPLRAQTTRRLSR